MEPPSNRHATDKAQFLGTVAGEGVETEGKQGGKTGKTTLGKWQDIPDAAVTGGKGSTFQK